MQPTAMHISLEIARFIAQAAVAGLWQGLVLIAAVGIFLHFMSRLGAAARFALWGFAFTLAATLPLMHLPAGTLIQPHGSSAVVLGAEWGFAIAAFWIILMLVRGTRLLMHAIYLRRVWKRAKPAASEPAIHALLLPRPAGRRALHIRRRRFAECDRLLLAAPSHTGVVICKACAVGTAAYCAS